MIIASSFLITFWTSHTSGNAIILIVSRASFTVSIVFLTVLTKPTYVEIAWVIGSFVHVSSASVGTSMLSTNGSGISRP